MSENERSCSCNGSNLFLSSSSLDGDVMQHGLSHLLLHFELGFTFAQFHFEHFDF